MPHKVTTGGSECPCWYTAVSIEQVARASVLRLDVEPPCSPMRISVLNPPLIDCQIPQGEGIRHVLRHKNLWEFI